MSKHLNKSQIGAIDKVGDCLIPGGQGFTRFSELGCSSQIDRILDYMPSADVNDLKTLLSVIGFFPRFGVSLILKLTDALQNMPGALGATVRLVRIGLRGLVMTLYYGDTRTHKVLDYSVGVYTADLDNKT